MTYNNDKDTYSCDICGFESKWEAKDDVHGNYGVVRSVERYSAPNALPTDLEAMNI